MGSKLALRRFNMLLVSNQLSIGSYFIDNSFFLLVKELVSDPA